MRKSLLLFVLIAFNTFLLLAQEDDYEDAKRYYREAQFSGRRADYEKTLKTAQYALEDFLHIRNGEKAEEMRDIIDSSSSVMSRMDNEIKKAIDERRIAAGMTKEDVIESWGYPRDINRTSTSGVVSEQWCFGDILEGTDRYVYFENGEVTSWQD